MAREPIDRAEMARMSGPEARALIRARRWAHPTIGVADGWVQANLVVLPREFADDFQRFCQLNPSPCPLLDVTEPGSAEPSGVAPGADLRLDVPRYRSYRHGAFETEHTDLTELWRADHVGFLLGCSFTFEAALQRAGIPLRHQELGCTVPMYRTNIACQPAGPFQGPLVVTMRPIPERQVPEAVAVTARFPRAHGAPIHVGGPAEIGIADLDHPDYGDPVPIYPGEVPVFWACGVTPQAAVEAADIDLMLTHAPGHMFITDLRDADLEG
jgi:uncharacterized protein YcsI (UPF0317 family)